MNTENIALITSTIRPDPKAFLLKRTNPEDRLLDYQTAFRFYCSKLQEGVFESLVYVDNSGYPLDSLRDIAHQMNCAERVEFISYSSTLDPTKSRFYLEMNLIDQAIKSSDKIQNKKYNFVWKITGRYMVKNIDKLVSKCPRDVDLYINSRDYPSKWADFFLVGFNPITFPNLLGNDIDSYLPMVDGEALLRNKMDNGDFNCFKLVKRFNVTPKIIGVRGYDAQSYNNFSNNAKYYVRVFMNRVLPQIWI